MRPAFLVTTLFVTAATTACTRQPIAATASSADSVAIDSLYQVFRIAYATLDAPKVTDLYREDALYGTGGSPGFTIGRPPIASNFEGFFQGIAADSATLELRFRFVRRFRKDDLASDAGYYWLRRVKGDSAGKPSVGKFVTVLQRDSTGQWRFAIDTYSGGSVAEFDAAPEYEP